VPGLAQLVRQTTKYGAGKMKIAIYGTTAVQLRNSYRVFLHEVTGNMKLDKLLVGHLARVLTYIEV
jgi:hypothetical protein